MSDNVPPHTSRTENPEYRWDPYQLDPWKNAVDICTLDPDLASPFQSHVASTPDCNPASSFGLARSEYRPASRVFSLHDFDSLTEEAQDVDMTLETELTSPAQLEPQDPTTTLREQTMAPSPSCYAVAPDSSILPDNDSFEFESGCRPIGQQINSGEQDSNAAASSDDRLKCEHPGCTSNRTFARKYELQRHMKKHAPPVSYPCPVLGYAYRGARAFYRADKLKVHLRMSHTDDALCRCPVQGCPNQQLTLTLLSLHAGYHGPELRAHHGLEVVKDYQKNLETDAARCPIGDSKSCGKWLAKTALPSHIRSHSEEERAKFREDALQAGYDSLTGNSVCPICHEAFPDLEDFAKHIHLAHLVEPGSADAAHMTAFYEALVGYLYHGGELGWPQQWKELNSLCSKKEGLSCPVCQASLYEMTNIYRQAGKMSMQLPPGRTYSNANRNGIDKHLKMRRKDITDVTLYRRQILRHYPSFINHPIFDDVHVTAST